jgi:molybdopterin converting factor subunit 1
LKAVAGANSNMPRITVRFHAGARDAAGVSRQDLDVASDETIGELKDRLIAEFPSLERFRRSLLFAIREEYASADHPLHDGDVVSCFPPVSGG